MDANERQGLEARWNRFERAVVTLRDTDYAREAQEAISDDTVHFLEALYPLWEYWCRLDPTKKRMPGQDNAVRGNRQAEIVAALAGARGGIPHDLVEFVDRTGDGYGTGRYGVGPYGVGYWAWRSYSTPRQGYEDRNTWYAQWVDGFTISEIAVTALDWFRDQSEVQVPK